MLEAFRTAPTVSAPIQHAKYESVGVWGWKPLIGFVLVAHNQRIRIQSSQFVSMQRDATKWSDEGSWPLVWVWAVCNHQPPDKWGVDGWNKSWAGMSSGYRQVGQGLRRKVQGSIPEVCLKASSSKMPLSLPAHWWIWIPLGKSEWITVKNNHIYNNKSIIFYIFYAWMSNLLSEISVEPWRFVSCIIQFYTICTVFFFLGDMGKNTFFYTR